MTLTNLIKTNDFVSWHLLPSEMAQTLSMKCVPPWINLLLLYCGLLLNSFLSEAKTYSWQLSPGLARAQGSPWDETIPSHPTFLPATLPQCGLHKWYEDKNVAKTLSVFIQSHKTEMDTIPGMEWITLAGAGLFIHLFHSPEEILLKIT